MSTHKYFDKVCCVVLVFILLVTVFFINAQKFGIEKIKAVLDYQDRLFDTSKVHTINIIMDNWDEFTDSCKSEEYYACSVIIDNEVYNNVAIRGKGNTSLTEVESYGNGRYSFKIEFDHYDSSNTYYGLDKLSLNNVIQDNTYMKDYLTYQMMNKMGVASPLCSYVYITVNGEDWGLYLAVEGVEESFLKRCYGSDYGELYKPESVDIQGGQKIGKKFDMNNPLQDATFENRSNLNVPKDFEFEKFSPDYTEYLPPRGFLDKESENQSEDVRDMSDEQKSGGIHNRMQPPGFQMQGGINSAEDNTGDNKEIVQKDNQQFYDNNRGNVKNSSDVLLKYIDDEIGSYSNIFDNAKTDVTNTDKKRLISALKKLTSREEISDTVDVDRVIKYFVVHNFVLNFDSYTGSMIHNYYLYEKEGQLQMIPWDYNLAFGGFGSGGSALNLVNFPIDSPVSGGNMQDRPMIAWIFENKEYTALYHNYFEKFISEYFDSGYFEDMIDNITQMISPYVEKDPTKFCTYEYFEKGVSTLKNFCLLRAESVSGQLKGTIGSSSDTQKSEDLIDTGNLEISDMGSMRNSMEKRVGTNDNMSKIDNLENSTKEYQDKNAQSVDDEKKSAALITADKKNKTEQKLDENLQNKTTSEFSFDGAGMPVQKYSDKKQPRSISVQEKGSNSGNRAVFFSEIILIIISAAVLFLGIGFAFLYKPRK